MPEQQNIEWKESWRDEYLKWICGFANAQGGKLYIGCDDNGKVVGVADCKKLMKIFRIRSGMLWASLLTSIVLPKVIKNILRSTFRRIRLASPAKAYTTIAAAARSRF